MKKLLGMLLGVCSILMSVSVWAEALDKVVAVVNDGVITQSELSAQVDMWRQQLRARKTELPPESALQKQVLNRLIDEALQLQLAKANGVVIDNAELDETINKIAADNHLTLPMLREALQKEGMTFDGYRENLRKEMLIARMQQQAVGRDIVISTQQVEDYLKTSLEADKAEHLFHVQNIVIPLSEEPTPGELKKAEAKAQYLLNKIKDGDDFSRLAIAESQGEYALEGGDLGERHLAELPSVFAKKVIHMKAGEVVGPVRTGNGFQLIKLVSTNHANAHHAVEKTHVRHILVKQDASLTEEQAKKQIENLYQQLKSGKSFAEVAKQNSMDVGSASKGGDLGWVTPDELLPAFSAEMKELALNTISKPVKTGFGWHLIEVLERKAIDDSEAFQRQQVRQYLHQRKFGEAIESWQQHVRGTSYINILDKDLA
ncbi:MAG: peptidylprolyl isomerase [Legionellaceae bacterium]|nr:peptidylprolyl isomerase [Legionellaceae bacterium]